MRRPLAVVFVCGREVGRGLRLRHLTLLKVVHNKLSQPEAATNKF